MRSINWSVRVAVALPWLSTFATAQTRVVPEWIRANAFPISKQGDTAFTLPSSTRDRLTSLAAAARVIGLGESLHDAHELLLVRAGISMSLIEQGRISAIVLESSLPTARRTDRWVTGETDSIPNFGRDLSFGWGAEAETIALLKRIRSWNLSQPRTRRVRFYGMDLPANGGGSLVPALNPVLTYLDRVDSALGASSRASLMPIARSLASDGFGIVDKYAKLSQAERDSLRLGLTSMIAALQQHAADYSRQAPQDDYEWALRDAEVALQTEHAVRIGWNDASNPRDDAMAKNVQWVVQREGSRGAVLVWSHNAHIARDSIRGPAFAARGGSPSVASLGQWIRKAFGDKYVALGTAFGRSTLDEQPVPVEKTSIDAVLAEVGLGAYFVDTGRVPEGPVGEWFDQPHLKRVDGGYAILSPRRGFDGLVFVDVLRQADHMQPNR